MLSRLNCNKVKVIIGNDRFLSYGSTNLERLNNYKKNIKISTKLWRDLVLIEIAIKNRVFQELCKVKYDWDITLKNKDIAKIIESHNLCYKNKITQAIIISRVTFGLVIHIVDILKSKYKIDVSNYLGNITKTDLLVLKEFRNAIAHHENICTKGRRVYPNGKPHIDKKTAKFINNRYYIYNYNIKNSDANYNKNFDLNIILEKVKTEILTWV